MKPLRVTTWNVLAPLMGGDKMFPGISRDVHDQSARRPVIQRQVRALGSDVLLLQEIRRAELRALLAEGESPLNDLYDSHYVPERSWQHCDAEGEAERGAAVLWCRGVLNDVEPLTEDLGPGGPPCVAVVRGTVVAWNEDVTFATAHLDGDAPVPAVARAQEQLLLVENAISKWSSASSCDRYIFGGDCNLTPHAPAMRHLPKDGLKVASGFPGRPTCFSVIAAARLDHVFMQGQLEAVSTEIPQCPKATCCPLACFCHPSQVMLDLMGFSKPRVAVPFCRRLCLLGCLSIPWLLAVVCCFCLPLPRSRLRCQWALEEWGSDHVPVTVSFQKTGTPEAAV